MFVSHKACRTTLYLPVGILVQPRFNLTVESATLKEVCHPGRTSSFLAIAESLRVQQQQQHTLAAIKLLMFYRSLHPTIRDNSTLLIKPP
jgi:hypothetical protein